MSLCKYILGAEWIRTACPPRHLCHYGDGFILTYDITNEESFNQIRKIKTEIEKELNKKDIPMTIVAMKTDLENQVISYIVGEHIDQVLILSVLLINELFKVGLIEKRLNIMKCQLWIEDFLPSQ